MKQVYETEEEQTSEEQGRREEQGPEQGSRAEEQGKGAVKWQTTEE